MSFYLLVKISQKYYTALELLSRVVFLTVKSEYSDWTAHWAFVANQHAKSQPKCWWHNLSVDRVLRVRSF